MVINDNGENTDGVPSALSTVEFDYTSSLKAVFQTSISCDGCDDSTAFASIYPASFGDEENDNNDSNGRRVLRRLVNMQYTSNNVADTDTSNRPRYLQDDNVRDTLFFPLNAAEILRKLEEKLAGISTVTGPDGGPVPIIEGFTGLNEAVIMSGDDSRGPGNGGLVSDLSTPMIRQQMTGKGIGKGSKGSKGTRGPKGSKTSAPSVSAAPSLCPVGDLILHVLPSHDTALTSKNPLITFVRVVACI